MERKERGVNGKKEEREEREEREEEEGGRKWGESYMWERKGNGVEKRKRGEEERAPRGRKSSLSCWMGRVRPGNARVVPHQWQEPLCSCVCQHVRR